MTAIGAGWIETTLLTLLEADTAVPGGLIELADGDKRIRESVDRVIRPLIDELGPAELRVHPSGDIAARFGPEGDDGLLLQTYLVSQHGNLMSDPQAPRIVDGIAVGQGANQNKGPMASAFAAVRQLPELRRPLWLTVNTEGRSSHGGSTRILDDLGVTSASGILAFSTDLRVSLGNRGRVDILVEITGKSSHSSQPWLGSNPIETAADVIVRLREATLPTDHPTLGPASVTPYHLRFAPLAPHTIPAAAHLVVDRRLLPGERTTDAVNAVRHLLADFDAVTVTEGVSMLPAQVDENSPVVQAIVRALGDDRAVMWSKNTFDAGYACSLGIPTVMFGPGKRDFGQGITAEESVAIADAERAASVLRAAVVELCG